MPLDLLDAAKKVAMYSRMGFHSGPHPPPNTAIIKAAAAVRLIVTEHDLIWPEHLEGLAFEGATRARLRDARLVLGGMPCRYVTVSDIRDSRGVARPRYGVLSTILLHGDWSWDGPFAQVYDVVINTSWREEGTACGGGSKHCLGLAAVAYFEALSMDQWYVCHECGCWRPREYVEHAFDHFETEEDRALNGDTMVCRSRYGRPGEYCG